jgi:UDP-N-acetyl-2-amino-2-deoxyglucuronate dehydrogenase
MNIGNLHSKNLSMPNFALIGAAGYIAPRHMQAIRDTGGRLVAAMDPSDSVGIIDNYFPDANFFTEFERFDRHLDKLSRRGGTDRVDYVSICSPNYLHDSHMRFALRSGADAICEKPLVLNPWNIDGLLEMEAATGRHIHTILQLRVHPVIVALRDQVRSAPATQRYDVDLAYVTSRDNWYQQSWKADDKKSGGIATNIGVHFFDMLHFLFGPLQHNVVHHRSSSRAAGYLEYERARVRWFLSINASDVPDAQRAKGQRTFRTITMDVREIEFSEGFTNLHTRAYEEILAGRGFGPEESRSAITAVSQIRTAAEEPGRDEQHPALVAALR